jgi:hypothetical protein
VNWRHPLSRRRERVRVRAVELKTVLIQLKNPHPQPFSRLREKGVNSIIEIELESVIGTPEGWASHIPDFI